MIEKLARNVVSWQIKKNLLQEEKESLYTYAYELLIGQVVNLLIACLLAVLFHDYVTVIVYLASYIPLRSYAGGHHANSYGVCTMVSAALICVACILVKAVPLDAIGLVNLAGAVISGGTVFLLAPVQDHNKPLEQIETIRYRRRSRIIWLLETFLWIICYLAGGRKASLAIVLAHITLSGMLVAGVIKTNLVSRHT